MHWCTSLPAGRGVLGLPWPPGVRGELPQGLLLSSLRAPAVLNLGMFQLQVRPVE